MTKEEFKRLFDSFFDSVRSYLFFRGAGVEEASDLAQDVFLRIWEKQMDINPKTAIRSWRVLANALKTNYINDQSNA